MSLGVFGGRFVCAALSAACLVAACGGQSIAVGGDDGSAGEGDMGGTGGTGGSVQGGSDVGGSFPAGGSFPTGGSFPAGGTGDGGTISVGGGVSTGGSTGGIAGTIPTGGVAGSVGVGGVGPCPECPAANYGLVVQGDGDAYDLTYNGIFPVPLETDAEQLLCPEQPVRGSIIGCGGGVYVTVCEDPMSGPPCLSVNGGTAMYVDQRTGAFWSGAVTSNVLNSIVASGDVSGTLTIELLNAGGGMLRLTVDYTFCATGVRTADICR